MSTEDSKEVKGKIHQFETFGSVDGPGIRFIIFVQGCPMRCQYCHNPETWDFKSGEEWTAQAVIEKALHYKEYWGTDGGITVSGGEPLAQIDFLLELFKEAKKFGIHTNIDTSGATFTRNGTWFKKFEELMQYTDMLMLDIKHIDPDEHIKLTGLKNNNIVDMFHYLDEINKPIWIRHVLVPGITDNDEYLKRTRDFIKTLHNVHRIDVLPYHAFAIPQYEKLGIPYPLMDTKSPSEERIKNAKAILEVEKYNS